LWFGDGVHFNLLPVVTYTWRRRGAPLRIPTPGSGVRVAVCGAYRWPHGPFVFSHGPRSVNTARFVEMVTQLGQRAKRTGKRVVLVLDNGSAHTSQRSTEILKRLRRFVRAVWLPPYSSEQLNEIEGLWKRLKEDHFSRMLVTKRGSFEGAVVGFLKGLRTAGAVNQLLRKRRPRRRCRNLGRAA